MKYLPSLTKFPSLVLALLVVLGFCPWAAASDILYTGPDGGDWNTFTNWASGVPPHIDFDEAGVVNNNTTVVLNAHTKSDPSFNPVPPGVDSNIGGLRLGSAAGTTGGLRIVSGGILEAVDGTPGGETGAVSIGSGGTGNLTMLGNGRLSGTSLTLGGGTGSSITMSDTSNIAISGAINLQRTTTLNGPGISFTGTGNLTLSGTSILVPGITAAGSPKIVAEGTAGINGTLKPMFTGVTPVAGNKWTLVDVPSTINGSFATIDTSMAAALPLGTTYSAFQETVGSRRLLQLAVEEILVLNVNRETGAVSIANIGTQPKSLDGYSILSAHGSLTGTWNSLDDQDFGGANAWVEANPEPDNLSELYPNEPAPGFSTVGTGSSLNLGTPYQVTVPELGVDPDDLTFEYNSPTRGTVRGVVNYSGRKIANDFVLTVDPANGQAQLKLDSPLATAIDGYAIYSDSGSLTPATWNSLQDQSVAGWEQAPPAPSANAVGELKADGSLQFQNNTGFQLGQLFKTVGATQDLRLEFLVPGQSIPSMGTVVYGPIIPVNPPSVGIPGDFNEDGKVDAADYVVWRKTDGTQNGYNDWRANFGRTSGSGSSIGSSSAVPEPGTAGLVLILSALAVVGRRAAGRQN